MTTIPQTKTEKWLTRRPSSSQVRVRLFCFPYAGRGASIFYEWQKRLPTTIEVCPVQLPGRENRVAESPFTRLPALVHAVAQAVLPHLNQPFAFFGHSMGALISFELARYLRKYHNLSPVQLIVSAQSAPHIPDKETPAHSLPEPEFMKKLHDLNGTAPEVMGHAELKTLMLPLLRADFEVCETHVYQADTPLDCPITAFGGLQDEFVDRAELQAWSEHTKAAFVLRMFSGDHFYLNTQQQLLTRMIARELATVPAPNLSGVQPGRASLAKSTWEIPGVYQKSNHKRV